MNVSFLRARSLPKRRSIRRALRPNHDGAVEKGADDAAGRRHGGTEIVVAALVHSVVDLEFGGRHCHDAMWIPHQGDVGGFGEFAL